MKRLLLLLYWIPLAYCSDFKLGLENIPPHFFQKITKKENTSLGLITNQTGKDQNNNRNIDLLLKKGFTIGVLFAPEHGIDGSYNAQNDVFDAVDKKTGIPIVSLYRNNVTGKHIPKPKAKHVDLFVYDIQDCGMRHYTFISTLLHTLQAAAHLKKPVVVLDRPNPLGYKMEGPIVQNEFRSFISIAAIPLRYAMTIGEVARYFNEYELKEKARLYVVPMKGYDRKQPVNLPAPLSTNLKNIESCYGYSFLGILGEVRPFTLSMGTEKAFQRILIPDSYGVPKKQWLHLTKLLKPLGVESIFYSGYSARKKSNCSGLEIKIRDINQVNSFQVLLTILSYFKKTGVSLTFSSCFNLALGTDVVEKYCNGNCGAQEVADFVNKNLKNFICKARNCLLYEPIPDCRFLKVANK